MFKRQQVFFLFFFRVSVSRCKVYKWSDSYRRVSLGFSMDSLDARGGGQFWHLLRSARAVRSAGVTAHTALPRPNEVVGHLYALRTHTRLDVSVLEVTVEVLVYVGYCRLV